MMQKTKIVWINDVPWANSGMSIQSKMIVAHLLDLGHDVHYLAWYTGKPGTKTQYNIAKDLSLDIHFLGENSFGSSYLIESLLTTINPDIVVSFGDMHMIQPLMGINRKWHKKWIHWWTVDDKSPDPTSLKTAQQIPNIVAITEFGANTIKSKMNRSVPIIGHAYQSELQIANKEDAKAILQIPSNAVVYGYIARNFWRKNINSLLNAFAYTCNNLLNKDQDARLLIHTDQAAPGIEGCDILEKTKELGLSGKVLLSTSSLSEDNMISLIDAMDYHVLTSYGEGFGVPVIETMARGVPNIVPMHTTLPELVRNSGFIVPLEVSGSIHPASGREYFAPDCLKLAQCLADTYELKTKHPAKYQQKQKQCLEQVGKYSPENIKNEWAKLIENFHFEQSAVMAPQEYELEFKFKKNKKILLCSMFYVPNLIGGGEHTAHELMKGLAKEGWDVAVLTLFDGIKGSVGKPLPDQEFVLDNVNIIQSGNNWYKHLTTILDNDAPDILMTYEISSWYSLRFLKEAKKRHIKTVMYEQYWRLLTENFTEISQQIPNPPRQGFECSRLTDLLITNSDFTAQMFKKFIGRTTPVVYPPMVLPSKPLENQGKYIVMVNPSKAKGIEVPIYLAAMLPDVPFKLVGAIGEDASFLEIKKYPNILYCPHTDDVDEIYQDAKVVLFPSMLEETFGRVVVEAMAYGIPVIARDTGAVSSVVEEHAILMKKDSKPSDWLQPLIKLLENPEQAFAIGQKGYDFAAKKFDRDGIINVFAGLVTKLFNRQTKYCPSQSSIRNVIVCDSGFHGVKTAIEYAKAHFENDFSLCTIDAHSGKDQIIDVFQAININTKFLIYAGWTNNYLTIMRAIKEKHPEIKHIINWHSPLGQTELSGARDIDAFVRCNQLLTAQEIEYIFVPFQKDADLFKKSFHKNYRWFPDTMAPIKCSPIELEKDVFKIGFFALPSSRKNILSQLAAVRLLHLAMSQGNLRWKGVRLYVGNGFDKQKAYIDYLDLLNIPYTTLPHFQNKQDYFNYLGSMNLNIQVTFSEAFNYVCAESLALGVPCMGSTMTPALYSTIPELQAILERFLVIQNIDDTEQVFEKMLVLATMNEATYLEIGKFCQVHVDTLTNYHNTAIKELFLELAAF